MSDTYDSQFPLTRQYSQEISFNDTSIKLHLFVVEYHNAIQVAVYDQKPSLGSMSFGYLIGEATQHLEIFSGKHNHFSNVLASLLTHLTKKIVYASVNLKNDAGIDIPILKKLLDQYINEMN